MTISAYDTLKAVADPTRMRLLCLINTCPGICVCQLMEALKLSQTTISKALGVLKKAGLVIDERDGQWMRYSLARQDGSHPIKQILKWASDAPDISADIKRLTKLKNLPLDVICSNKPWRK